MAGRAEEIEYGEHYDLAGAWHYSDELLPGQTLLLGAPYRTALAVITPASREITRAFCHGPRPFRRVLQSLCICDATARHMPTTELHHRLEMAGLLDTETGLTKDCILYIL